MSAINKGKHVVEEIDGIRCTIIEKGIDEKRLNFLKNILEFNHLEIKTATDKDGTFTIGTPSIIFNPVIAIYERSLKTKDGQIVTPAYWNQLSPYPGKYYWHFHLSV